MQRHQGWSMAGMFKKQGSPVVAKVGRVWNCHQAASRKVPQREDDFTPPTGQVTYVKEENYKTHQ